MLYQGFAFINNHFIETESEQSNCEVDSGSRGLKSHGLNLFKKEKIYFKEKSTVDLINALRKPTSFFGLRITFNHAYRLF